MSVQIQVEAVTKEPRIFKGQTQWGVKLPGNAGWVTLYREAKPTKGEMIDVNITERRGNNGQSYKDAFPVMPPLAPQTDKETPSKPLFNQFIMAEAFDFWVMKVNELQWTDDAKASVLCSLLIATADKRIPYELPLAGDDYVPPPEDEGPFS